MTFRQLAASNVRGNWHRYMAFFLSSVFSVMVFFLFAQFIYHPDVIHGNIRGAAGVRKGLIACQYIIIIFSALFILYSNSAFLKSRKKEFGLFTLFGMTAGQIRKLIIYENLLISAVSIVSGIACGALFSKLFFMAMTELLDVNNPIPFMLVPKALWMTAGVFLLAFQAVVWVSMIGAGKKPIIELLKASKKPKSLPVTSRWLTLLALASLAGGYALALRFGTDSLELIFPILFLVIIGTFFLFTQASVGLLKRLQRVYPVYYKRTNLVTVSQLVFKLKDNARILFMVTILSAVILTASGTCYIMFQDAKDQTTGRYPQTFGYMEKGLNAHEVLDPLKVESILQEDGQDLKYEGQLPAVPLEKTFKFTHLAPMQSVLVSESALNSYLEITGLRDPVEVKPGGAVLVTPFEEMREALSNPGDPIDFGVAGHPVQLRMEREIKKALINTMKPFEVLVVADDADFQAIAGSVKPEEMMVYYGYELKHWTMADATMNKLAAAVPESMRKSFDERVNPYIDYKQFNALTLFIGLFVSFLFFISAGSMIYFKLFTELQEDQALFRSLSRVGVSAKELMKIITTQIAVIFLVPVLVGAIHAAFAFKALQNLMGSNVWPYGSTVAAVFLLMQLTYFGIARRTYMRIVTRR